MRSLHTSPHTPFAYTLLLSLFTAAAAQGHGDPPGLAFWEVPARALRCQRTVARVAAGCIVKTLDVRRTCNEEQLGGGMCDADAVDDAVRDARLRTADLLRPPYCGGLDAALLNFGTTAEMQADVRNVCADVETSVVSATYRPVAADPEAGACIRATGRAATRLVRFATRAWRHSFDRMAARGPTFAVKQRLVERAERRIERARQRLVRQVERECGAGFAEIYGRPADDFFAGVADRCRCFTGESYVQGGVTCPPAVCGNGMLESGEQCDDGNTVGGDGCNGQCRRE